MPISKTNTHHAIMNELDHHFSAVAQIIENARNNTYRKINEELILMYQKSHILFHLMEVHILA